MISATRVGWLIFYWVNMILHTPLQPFDVGVDAAQFGRDLDALRAMLEALSAADAVVRLAQGRDGLVV